MEMGVFPGNENLTFGAPIISTTAPYKFKMRDFNHDGLLDVGMIFEQGIVGTDTIATALGSGNGIFQAIDADLRVFWKIFGSATTWKLVT